MTEQTTIASLRAELGMTLEEFGAAVGISSKGQMSQIERGLVDCSLTTALNIEQFSSGRIDAATLSRDVRMARASCAGGCSVDTSQANEPSPGSCEAISPEYREVNGSGAAAGAGAEGVAAAITNRATPEAAR